MGNIVSYLNGIHVYNAFLHCMVKTTTGIANSSCYSNCEGLSFVKLEKKIKGKKIIYIYDMYLDCLPSYI